MKNRKEVKKLAKLIFSASLINGKLDEKKLKKLVDLLKKNNSKNVVPILEFLNKLIQRKQKQDQLEIESVFPLETNLENMLKSKFEKVLNKKLKVIFTKNEKLIAGLKISNADYLWESSISSNLKQLKDAIINE